MSRVDEEAQMEATAAPLIEHLTELRRRLIWCVGGFLAGFILSFAFATSIFNALVVPFQWAVEWHGMTEDDVQFIYTAPQEFFFTQIKIGAFGGLVLAFPLIATQLYLFIAPGLYSNERGAFLPFLVATPVLFLIGAALVYFMIIPMAMWFFLSLEQTGGEGLASIQHLPRVSEYLSLIMTLIIAFGLVFQLPVALTLMSRAGLVTPEGLASKRKYAIVIAFVAAAILTPPDPMTQLGLAIPTILLFELSIFLARRFQPPPSEYDDEEDEDDEAVDEGPDDTPDPAKTAGP
ncbi:MULTISPECIES: twin-arginine translocase subunit TatC [unclassified Roseitalea]|uniref:twin-arginine translocase subunit TatC n=1 Tax=unclassified Roseitalea TaxID=2639107 RepID=UPI0032087AE8